MAKWILVSMRDAAAETFAPPFCVPQEAVAVRSFANEVNRADDKNAMFTNSQHFDLFRLGMFDDETGFYTPETADGQQRPKLLVRGEEVKRTVQ